jgi:hypothetical protein
LRAIAIALAALVLSVVLFTWHSKVEAERAQAIRDASYREALSRFQRDLFTITFDPIQWSERNGIDALVPVGRDPAPVDSVCEYFYVSISFRFNKLPHQRESSPLDNLREISIDKDCQK